MRTTLLGVALGLALAGCSGAARAPAKPASALPPDTTDETGPSYPAAVEHDRFRGHLVWGHESRTFTGCGGEREGWVINEAGEELVAVYDALTTAPYQPLFVEVRGTWVAPPPEGLGADFDEALQVTELLRAENEGFGCRLALDGILFVASGNEPSWRVQVRDDGIRLRTMDTPEGVVFAAPKQRGRAPLISFESGGGDSTIRVTLQQRRCVDTMSGARFAWAATVDVDGRQLAGCAAEGLQVMPGAMTELDALSWDSIGGGIGYNICLMNLDSPDEDLRGSLQLRHNGPIVFACLRL